MASHFVAILGSERSAASRRATILLTVTVLLAVPAYFILPWQGLLAHVVAAVLGLVLGNLWSRRRVQTYERSLRGTWKSWMRWAMACESVPEVHRRVEGRSGRNLPWWAAALLTTLWALEIGLLALHFSDVESAAFAFPVLVLNGLVPAAIAAYYLHLRGWVDELKQSLADLVASGEIGVWGVL